MSSLLVMRVPLLFLVRRSLGKFSIGDFRVWLSTSTAAVRRSRGSSGPVDGSVRRWWGDNVVDIVRFAFVVSLLSVRGTRVGMGCVYVED